VDEYEVLVAGEPVPYRTAGEGPPLLLVHGLAGSWRWWERAVPELAARRRVYLVDLPGFGGLRGRRFALGDAPAFVAAFLDALGLGAVDVAGHSLGGVVCARLAASHPEHVRRLVLVAPAAVAGERTMVAYAWPFFRLARKASPSFARMVAGDARRCGLPTLWRASRELLRDRGVLDDMRAIRVPALLVWGELDPLVPPALAPAVAAAIPGARLLLVPGAGHVPMFELPDAFAAEVLAFLDEP
jgi:pimeloyl-ACP methyl ester carboxylesterase